MSASTEELKDQHGGRKGQEGQSAKGRLKASLTPPPKPGPSGSGRHPARRRLIGGTSAVVGCTGVAVTSVLK